MNREPIKEPSASLFDWIGSGFLCSSFTVALPILLAYRFTGKTGMEKAMTAMVNPLFLVWFCILTAALVARGRGEKGLFRGLFSLGLFLWACSAPYVVNSVVAKWEHQYPIQTLDEFEPYDVVIVLGGGCSSRPAKDPQLNDAGDRIAFSARLYKRGLAKKLVTTGSNLELVGSLLGELQQGDGPSEQTKQIWMDLGIPENDIEQISGQNTSAEMAGLAERKDLWQGKRCGLVTSAFHMPRAMTLANQAGLELDPIPANFWSGPDDQPVTMEMFLPSPYAMDQIGKLTKEWIGIRIKR
ncbi:YdcF family protein [Pirellulaceae bacterium SH449]